MQFIIVRMENGFCYVAHLTGAAGTQVPIYDLVTDEPMPIHHAIQKVNALVAGDEAPISGTDKDATR